MHRYDVVLWLLHSNEPVAVVDNTELPQLFVTDTTGADGTALEPITRCPVHLYIRPP